MGPKGGPWRGRRGTEGEARGGPGEGARGGPKVRPVEGPERGRSGNARVHDFRSLAPPDVTTGGGTCEDRQPWVAEAQTWNEKTTKSKIDF